MVYTRNNLIYKYNTMKKTMIKPAMNKKTPAKKVDAKKTDMSKMSFLERMAMLRAKKK